MISNQGPINDGFYLQEKESKSKYYVLREMPVVSMALVCVFVNF